MGPIIKMIMAGLKTPAIKKYGVEAVNKALAFMKQNPAKVEKMTTSVEQIPASKLPIFEKLSPKFVGKGYDYSYLTKGTDIAKGMMKNTTKGSRTSLAKLMKKN